MPTSSLSGTQSPCFHPALGERCSVVGAGACDVGNDATVEVTRQTTAQSQPTNTEHAVSEPNMGSLWGNLPDSCRRRAFRCLLSRPTQPPGAAKVGQRLPVKCSVDLLPSCT